MGFLYGVKNNKVWFVSIYLTDLSKAVMWGLTHSRCSVNMCWIMNELQIILELFWLWICVPLFCEVKLNSQSLHSFLIHSCFMKFPYLHIVCGRIKPNWMSLSLTLLKKASIWVLWSAMNSVSQTPLKAPITETIEPSGTIRFPCKDTAVTHLVKNPHIFSSVQQVSIECPALKVLNGNWFPTPSI